MNAGFFASDSYILDNVSKLHGIPGYIVQGRYDVVCPMKSAWELHQAWPESQLEIMPYCGHSATEVETTKKLVEACNRFRQLKRY